MNENIEEVVLGMCRDCKSVPVKKNGYLCSACSKAYSGLFSDDRHQYTKRFSDDVSRECARCEVVKLYSEFHKGYSICKDCRRLSRKRRIPEKTFDAEHLRQKCLTCGEFKRIDGFKDYRHCYACRHLKGLTANLERYDLTPGEYVKMFDEQGGVCAICKQPEKRHKRLAVDHDHSCCSELNTCGKCIRGLLCFRCNAGLGNFRDDATLLSDAVQYLESY